MDLDLSQNLIECIICFYPVINDKYVTDCSHTFHHICIYEWYQQRQKCPLCTKDIQINPFINCNENNENNELGHSIPTVSQLVDNSEFQRYLEYIQRQRYKREQRELNNARNEQNNQHNQHNPTVLIINDYNRLENDDYNEHSQIYNEIIITNNERIKMKICIIFELTSTLVLITYITDVIQSVIITLSTVSSISYRIKLNDIKSLSLLFKIIFILYSLTLIEKIYYQLLFTVIPWVLISLV